MASCRVLAHNIQLYTANVSSSGSRPLVVFFPWLLAKEGAVQKFVSLYRRLGLDVVVAQGQAKHFLLPKSGMGFVAELDRCLAGVDWLDGRELFFHGTSVGAYLLTLFQMHLTHEHRTLDLLKGPLRGQVMDSIVYGGVDRMITGLTDSLAQPRALRLASQSLVGAYFRAFHGSTLQFFERSLAFYQTGLAVSPMLFFYAENDTLCDVQLLTSRVLPALRERGHAVTTVSWQESIHAAHYHQHPNDYARALENFVANCRCSSSAAPSSSSGSDGVSAKL